MGVASVVGGGMVNVLTVVAPELRCSEQAVHSKNTNR